MSTSTLPFCECGCGRRVTGWYKQTRPELGHIKGEPHRRISGHSTDRIPLKERIWNNTDRSGPGGCWVWIGYCADNGYGQIGIGDKSTWAHRASYEVHRGDIPAGMHVDHLCRNRACVNPDHLEVVTPKENSRRGLKGAMKTHCVNGHPWEENKYVKGTNKFGNPSHGCRLCHNIRQREKYRASKADS